MRLSELLTVLESIAPTRFAEAWDNVGLLAGERSQPVSKVLLTIDYTTEVAQEGRDEGCDAVISYHPPIFQALKRIDGGSVIHDAIRRGVAIYSPHTALDVAAGGTNDALCDVLGLVKREPLKLIEANSRQCKLITFVPEKDVERVSAALFEAGAGRIGNYSCCSFRSAGTGTFFGEEGSQPAVGESGKLERTPEIRLEVVVPIEAISKVVGALRETHPYEEPAFDLQQLVLPPEGIGQGRIGTFAVPTPREPLFDRIKQLLEIQNLLVAGPMTGTIRKAAVCAGSCGEMISDALAQGAELFLTGEMRHHDALRAAAAGMTVVCTLHSNSERITLRRFAQRLGEALPELVFLVSRRDRDPFVVR